MGGYFTVDNAFWSDPDVSDNYTPEDKYFYLYLLTCPNANISGCYGLTIKQMVFNTGYDQDTIRRLITRLSEVHKVIEYDLDTKEILVKNWWKHHWTTSPKYLVSLKEKISQVNSERFKDFLNQKLSTFLNSNGTDDSATTQLVPPKKKRRNGISPKKRMDVLERDKFTCRYCGRSAPNVVLEVDHILPVLHGGTDDLSNLVTTCWECNNGKRDRVFEKVSGEE